MRRLVPKAVPYSSVVGASLMLCDESSGACVAMLGLMNGSEQLTREQSESVNSQLVRLIRQNKGLVLFAPGESNKPAPETD